MTEMAMAALAASPIHVPARVPTTISWHSFDLRSGRRGPQVTTDKMGAVSKILNEATEAEIGVQIYRDGAEVPGWKAATQPAWVMLAALDENETPVWGGMVYRRRSDSGSWVTLNMVTLEAYLDRRYINTDFTFDNADQISEIAAQVVQGSITGTYGEGVEFTIDAPWSNWLRDRTYTVDEDKTVLSVLQELAGIEDGIEFTVELGWANDEHTILDRIIRFRNRVGTAYTGTVGSASDHPKATFHMPGSVVGFEYIEDYSPENGANSVVATSSGEGDTRPESRMWYGIGTTDAGMARLEYRFQPSTSIIETATLDDHAYTMLRQTWDGMNELSLEANLDTAPRVGSDWFLGDDVAVSLTCPRFPERVDADGAHVPGYQANVRCIGWEIDYDARRLKPRLLEAREVEVEAL